MKKVLSVVLALVMMLSVFSVAFVSANTDSDYTMVAGETRTVSLPGAVYDDFVIVKYVAVGNGKIVISSDGKNEMICNPVIEVYKDSMKSGNFIGDAENNGTYHNFKYELNCVAGTAYYFAMHNSIDNDNAEWDVTIECLHEVYDDGICLTCLKECDHVKGDNIVGCCPCGEEFDGEDIVVGKKYDMEADTDYSWFRFDVKETAAYILQSDNTDDADTILVDAADPAFIITDETGKIVFANDANVSADDKNFNFPYLFTGSERYFIGVKSSKDLADDWSFTLVDGTVHTIEEPKEVEVVAKDENGNTIYEVEVDENGEPKVDESGNPVYKVEVDENGQPKVDENGNPVYVPVYTTETIIEYIDHDLTYLPHKDANHEEAGHTPSVVCNVCNETIAGGDVIPQITECVDADADNACDVCGKVMVEPEEPEEPEDPTKDCTCNCHKKGISKFLFDFILFFQKIFRLNSVCSCGVRHY